MVERLLIQPEVRGAIPRISKVKDIDYLFNFLQKILNIEILYKKYLPRKFITSCLPIETKASSTVLHHGDVAQMVETSWHARCTGIDAPYLQTRATHQMVITISI